MSNGVFREPAQELEHLTGEISELKDLLRDMSKRLGQIERHVNRAFNVPKTLSAKKKTTKKSFPEKATIDAEQALKIFDELASAWNTENSRTVEDKLQSMTVPDLKIIAYELGLTFKGKPSKKALCSGIMGRINERIMLSKNTNITQPKSKKTDNSDGNKVASSGQGVIFKDESTQSVGKENNNVAENNEAIQPNSSIDNVPESSVVNST